MKAFFSIHDSSGIYKWTCKDVELITGYSTSEMVGILSYDLFHPRDLRKIVTSHLNVANSTQQVTYRLRKKNGRFIWVRTFSHDHGVNNEIICLTIELDTFHSILFRLFGI